MDCMVAFQSGSNVEKFKKVPKFKPCTDAKALAQAF
jgi:hypothetical protein